jgi:hypothetical protein
VLAALQLAILSKDPSKSALAKQLAEAKLVSGRGSVYAAHHVMLNHNATWQQDADRKCSQCSRVVVVPTYIPRLQEVDNLKQQLAGGGRGGVANGKGPAPGASTITQQVKEYSNKAVVSVWNRQPLEAHQC